MNAAMRERIAILLLPALAISLGWWMWLRPTAAREEARAKLAGAQATSPVAGAIEAEHRLLGEAAADVKRLVDEQKAMLARWVELRRARQDRGASVIEQVAATFRRHDLSVTKDERLSAEQNLPSVEPLTKTLERLAKRPEEIIPELKAPVKRSPTANRTGPTVALLPADAEAEATPQARRTTHTFWRIEFVGRYADVRAALADLAHEEMGAIPVQLIMAKASANLSLRRWTLVVCL